MSPRDLVDEGIAAGCLEWVPDDYATRHAAPAAGVSTHQAAAPFICPGCDQTWHDYDHGPGWATCDACQIRWTHAPNEAGALAEAQRRALEASEAPAPRPGALLEALCAMLQAFPEARNADQDRARRAGLGAIDLLCGFPQPADVRELARAVAELDRLRALVGDTKVGTDALIASLTQAARRLEAAARRVVQGAV